MNTTTALIWRGLAKTAALQKPIPAGQIKTAARWLTDNQLAQLCKKAKQVQPKKLK